jgi:hypothetical protein
VLPRAASCVDNPPSAYRFKSQPDRKCSCNLQIAIELALAHGNCCTRMDIQSYIANDDVQRPLQDKEMLVLVLVNVYRHTIARIRDYLNILP